MWGKFAAMLMLFFFAVLKCDSHAADLGDDAATNAVERFAEANFSRINNKNGFLMVGASVTSMRNRGIRPLFSTVV